MIIGISAKMGCGKTTLANLILKELPEFKRKGFADVLKHECSVMYGYPNKWNYTEEGKNEFVTCLTISDKPITVRELLQWHGTEFRREQDPDYWIKEMERQIGSDEDIVIDDIRFPNEADFVKKRNGLLIRVNPYPEWVPEKYSNHVSETALDDYGKWNLILNPEYGKLKSYIPLVKSLVKGYKGEYNET